MFGRKLGLYNHLNVWDNCRDRRKVVETTNYTAVSDGEGADTRGRTYRISDQSGHCHHEDTRLPKSVRRPLGAHHLLLPLITRPSGPFTHWHNLLDGPTRAHLWTRIAPDLP